MNCNCGRELSKRNKSGLCQPCSKIGKWKKGMKFNGIELINFEKQNNKGYVVWKCKCYCGKEFLSTPSKLKSNRVKSCGCSHVEHCKNLGKKQTGKNNPAWIKDRTKTSLYIRGKDFLRNKYGSWQYLSRKIKEERHFKCEITNKKLNSNKLAVHHIQSVTLFPELSRDKTNLVLLDSIVHRNFHSKYGKKTTEKDWENYLGEIS
jgi:hypothetical protein